MTKDGTGTLILRGSSNYTATTTVNSGVMQLDFSPATTPTSNILYNGLATPGAVVLAGGTLQLNGKSATTNSQALGTLTLSNYSNLSFTQNGATSLSLSMTTISRGFGSILGIDLPTSGTLTTTGGVSNTILTSGSRAFAFIRDAINGDDSVTAKLETINMATAGSLRKRDGAALDMVPLLRSSDQAALMPAQQFQGMPDFATLLRDFKPTGQRYVLAARVRGMVNSAFPDGTPKEEKAKDE